MLHYITKLKGFHIIATDGDAGHVDDFLVDERLNIRHLVIDTSNWFGGESVLISPAAIQKIDSPNKQIQVTLTPRRDQGQSVGGHGGYRADRDAAAADYLMAEAQWLATQAEAIAISHQPVTSSRPAWQPPWRRGRGES